MAEVLISPGISITETDQSAIASRPLVAGAAIIGPTVKGMPFVPTRVTSYSSYVRTFGTTFSTTNSEDQVEQQEFLTSLAAKSYFEQGGESLLVTRVVNNAAFGPATSSTVIAKDVSNNNPFVLYTLGSGASYNNVAGGAYTIGSGSEDERTSDGSLRSGSIDNFRYEISNIDEDSGTFSLAIRRGDDTTNDQVILETYTNLSLDPNSTNYIAKVIGDQETTIVDNGAGETYVGVQGSYINNSSYVRVKVLKPTLNWFETDGVTPRAGYTGSLPVAQKGGFSGGTGVVGVCYGTNSTEDSEGTALYFDEIKKTEGTADYNQSIKAADYETAITVLENTDEYEFNIISAPGFFDPQGSLTSLARDVRKDCIAVLDLVDYSVKAPANVVSETAGINSSYAAAYWPWLQMSSATGRLEWVPASVVIPGIYAYNDKVAAPWYAPAGMVRGGVQGVTQTAIKLTKSMRDTLYAKNVNPIATLPGTGIVVYGQKTLQKKASALDRVNVRRLLIELKKKVKEMAGSLLFEQNTQALQNSFRAQLDPYLTSIVERHGLYDYSIDLGGNTSDAIDRNEFHCTIYIQPTKVIEFIYLNFTITATGVEFK